MRDLKRLAADVACKQRKYKARKNAGRCADCNREHSGVRPNGEPYTRCAVCREARADYMREFHRKMGRAVRLTAKEAEPVLVPAIVHKPQPRTFYVKDLIVVRYQWASVV